MPSETLRKYVRQVEADEGLRPDLPTSAGARGDQAAAQGELRAAPRERDPEGRVGVFRERARPRPTEVSAFIDEHRERFGVEPICRTLGVSASAYYQRASGRALGARGRGRAAARADPRAARGQLLRLRLPADVEGAAARRRAGRPRPRRAADARATASRAPSGAASRGGPRRPTRRRSGRPISSSATSRAARPERALGRGLHLPALLGGRRLLQLRHRRLQPRGRRLAVRRATCAPTSSSTRCGWRSHAAQPGADVELVHHTDAGSQYTVVRLHPDPRRPRRARVGRHRSATPTTTRSPRASSTASRPS